MSGFRCELSAVRGPHRVHNKMIVQMGTVQMRRYNGLMAWAGTLHELPPEAVHQVSVRPVLRMKRLDNMIGGVPLRVCPHALRSAEFRCGKLRRAHPYA